jgi:SLOG in TRPM, prokaryote
MMMMPFQVSFPNHRATALHVNASMPLTDALSALGFDGQHYPVIVIIGGASKLSDADFQRVRRLFFEVLAPIAQKWQACVVDGGTDAGIMRLMGQARTAIGGDFPLVGVTPIDLACLPGQPPASPDAATLEPHHTHFLLVPGSNWGDESDDLAQVATALAGKLPSVTLLINGGEVTWQDAAQSIQSGRSLITIDGSGRTADLLAAGLRGEPTDIRAVPLVASGQVQSLSLMAETKDCIALIESMLAI